MRQTERVRFRSSTPATKTPFQVVCGLGAVVLFVVAVVLSAWAFFGTW